MYWFSKTYFFIQYQTSKKNWSENNKRPSFEMSHHTVEHKNRNFVPKCTKIMRLWNNGSFFPLQPFITENDIVCAC